MKPKKILHLIETSGPGGAESMLVNHIHALQRQGIESHVLLLKEGWLRERLNKLEIKCQVVPLNRFFSVAWLAQVRSLINREKYTALHSHEFAMNCHTAILSLLCQTPAVATIHGKNYYSEKLARRLLYKCMAKISTFIAVSEDIRTFLIARLRLSPNDVKVISNGIDLGKHKFNAEARASVRAELTIDDDDILIGAVGNLYPVKGHSYLIRAAAKLLSAERNIKFFVAGRGGEREKLQAEIDELGIGKYFSLLGFREDVDRLLQGIDVFAMPSLSEGLPISILEAMAAKKVVIASQVGGIPELITNGVNGVLVPAKDADKLAKALLELTRDAKKRNNIAQKAFIDVSEKYSQDTCTSAYVKLYSDS